MGLASRVALQHGEKLLVESAEALRSRVEAGDQTALAEYCEVLRTLATIGRAVAPEATGGLLTTEEMAQKMGLSVRSLLRHKKAGTIKPTLQHGKLLRWSGRESL